MLTALASPFVVAHRAGNAVETAREAAAQGASVVEADIRLFRGRLEVRHLKTLGPLPVLWDRWQLASPFADRLCLRDLLDSDAGSDLRLLLDLKGRDPRLVPLLLEALDGRRAIVCSRSWPLLDLLHNAPGIDVVHSVGTPRELRRLVGRGERVAAVAVHEGLLDRVSLSRLYGLAGVVLSWPVNTVARARELVSLGVDGLISDRPALIREAFAAPAGAAAA